MHIGAMAKRRAEAQASIEAAVEVLTARGGFVPPERMHTRDPQVQALFDLEYCAAVLDAATAEERPLGHTSDILNGTVADVSAAMSIIDDAEALAVLREQEAVDKGRKGVLEAIDKRAEELAAVAEAEAAAAGEGVE